MADEELKAAFDELALDDQVEIRRVIDDETLTAFTTKRAFEDPYAGDGWVVVLRDAMGNELGTYAPVSEAALVDEPVDDKGDTDPTKSPRRGKDKE